MEDTRIDIKDKVVSDSYRSLISQNNQKGSIVIYLIQS